MNSAQTAHSQAQGQVDSATTAQSNAQTAVSQAQQAVNQASATASQAQDAMNHTNNLYSQAQSQVQNATEANMASASQAVTTAQTTVSQNSQAVTSAQTAASNADQAVQSAQNKVNADQAQVDNLSKGTPADTTTQQNAVNTAKTALDNANGQVTTATNNVTTAQSAKTTADQNVTTAKIALDNAKSEEANKRAALSKAEETVTSAQNTLKSAQNTLTNAQDAQKNQNSVINLPDSWYQEAKAKGDDAEVDKNYEDEGNKLLNSWVNNPADEKIKYTIGSGIKLPENLMIQLTRYFASLINPIRERLGHKPLIVNRGAVDYAIDCSYVFEWGDNDDEQVARKYGVTSYSPFFSCFLQDINGNFLTYRDGLKTRTFTLNALKRAIYQGVVNCCIGDFNSFGQDGEVALGVNPFALAYQLMHMKDDKFDEQALGMGILSDGQMNYYLFNISDGVVKVKDGEDKYNYLGLHDPNGLYMQLAKTTYSTDPSSVAPDPVKLQQAVTDAQNTLSAAKIQEAVAEAAHTAALNALNDAPMKLYRAQLKQSQATEQVVTA